MKKRLEEEREMIALKNEENIDDDDDENKYLPQSSKKPEDKSTGIYILMLALAIGTKTLQPLAIANSKNENGMYFWNKTTMVILVEIVKLVFCSIVFIFQYFSTDLRKRELLHNLPLYKSLHFLVPAVLYGISNTLVYIGMSYINPALFHVFGNVRILTAGVMYRLIVGKKQNDIQWLSLILLTAGAILATPTGEEKLSKNDNYFLGFFFSFLMCTASTASSIYTEINFKKTQELSIFYQNIVLYTYGIFVNILFLFATDIERITERGFFYGYDSSAVLVLIVQSSMGISLSFLFKYLDTIVYVISLTVSMFISAIFSIFLFDFEFSITFCCSLVIVTIAIYQFYREKVLEKYGLKEKDVIF